MPQVPNTEAQVNESNVAAPVAEAPATQPETKAAAPKATSRKTVKKAAKKAPEKKAAKAAPKASENGKKEAKSGLRKPQERLLQTLAKGGQMSRSVLADKAKVDRAACTEYLGSLDEKVRLANDKKHFPSLISLKYVKVVAAEKDGAETYEYAITAPGKSVVEKLNK